MAKKKPKETSGFWIYSTNENKEIETIIKALLNYRVNHKGMLLECSEWIINLCEENGYDKLIGYDLRQFIANKWNEYESDLNK